MSSHAPKSACAGASCRRRRVRSTGRRAASPCPSRCRLAVGDRVHVADLPRAVHLVADAPDPHAVRIPRAAIGPLGAGRGVAVLDEVARGVEPARAHVDRQHRLHAGATGPGQELVGPDLVGLDRAPGQFEAPRPRLARADAVLPVVARDEVAARVAHDRDAQLADELEHVLADAVAVALVDPAVHAAAHVLDERAVHALVDFRHGERGVDDQPGPLHAVNATSAGLAMFSNGEAVVCERYQAHAEGGSHRRRGTRRRGCARRGEHRLAVRRHLADGDVLAPVRRRRRRAAGGDPRRDRRRARATATCAS